jgi:hypothetical protein
VEGSRAVVDEEKPGPPRAGVMVAASAVVKAETRLASRMARVVVHSTVTNPVELLKGWSVEGLAVQLVAVQLEEWRVVGLVRRLGSALAVTLAAAAMASAPRP